MPFAYFTTACSAKPSPQEELDLQARFLPTVYNIDAGTYAFVSKEAPTPLTKQMYEDALFKQLIKRYDDQAKCKFQA